MVGQTLWKELARGKERTLARATPGVSESEKARDRVVDVGRGEIAKGTQMERVRQRRRSPLYLLYVVYTLEDNGTALAG